MSAAVRSMPGGLCVQVADLQRSFTSTLLTFEQRHWAALLGNEQRLTHKVEQVLMRLSWCCCCLVLACFSTKSLGLHLC